MAIDIRVVKSRIRDEMKEYRRCLSPEEKAAMDGAIFQRLCRVRQYQAAGLVLVYVSMPIEVETREIIRHAWSQGKRVAVPYCVEGTREMEFYEIKSFDQLEKRTFGVEEPRPQDCPRLEEFPVSSVCVVPALAYDTAGYRMGYGGGYYDRFLSHYRGTKVGIVYCRCVSRRLIHGRYDVPVDLLVTEKYIRGTSPRKKH